MKTIFTVLQDIEKLIYKILMWIILIPKTVVSITLFPKWASEYVRSELKDGESHFDEYVSPVILLLVVALLPSLGYNALPKFGASISSPAETNLTTDRFLSFEAKADFISSSTELEYFAAWEVWKKNASGEFEFENSAYHPDPDGGAVIVKVDGNTIQDRFLYTFTPGEYLVYASVGNANPEREDFPVLETYEAYLNVIVPVDTSAQVKVSSESAETLDEKASSSSSNFLDRVKEEQTIFLALALMIPPLLFALVSKAFRGEAIAEGTLKENFYVQCYYFSPLSVALWGTYYALYFYTADAYLFSSYDTSIQILFVPLILAVLWFIRTEVKNIAWERSTSITQSLLIVAACIAALGYAANILFSFDIYMNDLRIFAIRIFPILAVSLLLAFGFAWYGRRKEKKENILSWNTAGLAIIAIAFFGFMRLVSGLTLFSSPAPEMVEPQFTSVPAFVESTSTVVVEATQTLVEATSTVVETLPVAGDATTTVVESTPVVEPTPTLEPSPTPEPLRFYTEEFNSLPVNWFELMTYGDRRMITETVEDGKLAISIRPLDEKPAWYYLISNDFTYANVKVEAVVINQGNNANGVSLVCRYSDVGWYEFVLSNSGFYSIFAVDNQGIVSQGYNEIADGGSARIKTGRQTNVYTAICSRNELILIINGTEVRRITDTTFLFGEGKIGLAVSSMQKLPVSVEFEALTISEP